MRCNYCDAFLLNGHDLKNCRKIRKLKDEREAEITNLKTQLMSVGNSHGIGYTAVDSNGNMATSLLQCHRENNKLKDEVSELKVGKLMHMEQLAQKDALIAEAKPFVNGEHHHSLKIKERREWLEKTKDIK